ncbi:MAG: YidH family protein [Thermomicrobiales bacterium]
MSDAAAPAVRVDPDSRARTHLANERTFLAWLRTGLALMALGFAASEFLPDPKQGQIDLAALMSVVLVCGGFGLTAYGGWRYRRTTAQIDTGSYRPAAGMVIVSVGLMAAIAIFVLLFIAEYHR